MPSPYQAKTAGRNTVRFYDPSMQAALDRRSTLENELRHAIKRGEFTLNTIRKISTLKELGIHFSLDDFGTGFSSFSCLTRLSLDQLKIDKSFVLNLPDSGADAAIVTAIITMARSLGLNIIAEGVETEAQRVFLDSQGCHAYQGHLFGRPMPEEAFEAFVRGI